MKLTAKEARVISHEIIKSATRYLHEQNPRLFFKVGHAWISMFETHDDIYINDVDSYDPYIELLRQKFPKVEWGYDISWDDNSVLGIDIFVNGRDLCYIKSGTVLELDWEEYAK